MIDQICGGMRRGSGWRYEGVLPQRESEVGDGASGREVRESGRGGGAPFGVAESHSRLRNWRMGKEIRTNSDRGQSVLVL